MVHEWVYISDKGHLKTAFAVGSITSWLWWLQVPFSVSASSLKSVCQDEPIIKGSFRFPFALTPWDLLWLFRFHVDVQIWSDYRELVCPCLDWRCPWMFFSGLMASWVILGVTDSFCFRSPLTHTCTDTYNLHTAIQQDAQPCTAGPWAVLVHWPTGVFALMDVSFLSFSFSASARPL